MSDAIVVYICPECERWQKRSGLCESLCEVKTIPVEMVPSGRSPESTVRLYGGSE